MSIDFSTLPHEPILLDGTDLRKLSEKVCIGLVANGCVSWGWRNSMVETVHSGIVRRQASKKKLNQCEEQWQLLETDHDRLDFLKTYVQFGFGIPDSYMFRLNASLANFFSKAITLSQTQENSIFSWVDLLSYTLNSTTIDAIELPLGCNTLKLRDLFGSEWVHARIVLLNLQAGLENEERRLGETGVFAYLAMLGYEQVPFWWQGPQWSILTESYLGLQDCPSSLDPSVLRETPWLLDDTAASFIIKHRYDFDLPLPMRPQPSEKALALAHWFLGDPRNLPQ